MIEWLAAGAALIWLISGNDKKEDKTKEQIEDVEIVEHILSEKEKNEILAFDRSLKFLMRIKSTYIKEARIQNLLNKYSKVFNELQYASIDSFDDEEMYNITQKYFQILNGEIQVQKKYIEEELKKNKELFDNIDGKSLDLQQREAVVTDEENSLIIAGAGSGKTLTIAAKVKYLCDVKKINPKDILLVTFTKKAADEMYERINNKLGIDVEVKTFHSLGYEIIGHFTGKKPSVFERNISKKFLKSCVVNDLELQRKLITFFSLYTCDSFEADMYDNIGEYYNNNSFNYYETIKQKVTLKGERVKSKQELAIANFFFINGIKYEYEKDYKIDTRSKYHRQYKPDFYLPTIDVYIEHFSIDENEKCPQYTKIEEIKYLEGIKYKRNLHRKYNTKLEETYSYDFTNGNIYTKLNNILAKYSLKKKIMPENYVHICIEKLNKDKRYQEYFNLLNTFLALFKSNGYNEDNIIQMKNEAYNKEINYIREKHLLFLDVFKKYYNFYQNELKTNDKIDFNDMINMSTQYIKENSMEEFNYKYIIIDEFQDISLARYKLIKELKEKNNAQVIAVGDDWQSIYRFAGSDISIFTKFKEYFGNTKYLKIEKTYRNSKELIDIAGKFIMKNDEQIKKELASAKRQANPIEVIYYNEYSKDQNSFEMMLNWILQKIEDKEKKTIMLLGRHGFDIDILNESKLFDIKTEKNGNKIIHSKLYEKANIIFMTVHRSKGLEADEVIIINNKNNIVGFPNKVMNDTILDYVLQNDSNFLFDEERRLFYVALTRTKNKCYLMTPKDNPSHFVEELLSEYNITEFNNQLIGTQLYCPKCLAGHLVERESKNRTFLGCSNYPQCDYTLNVAKDKNVLSCPSCGGYLILREPYDFYGCSNYPHCTFKINKIDAIGSKYQIKTSKKEWREQQNKFLNYKKNSLSKSSLEALLKQYREE